MKCIFCKLDLQTTGRFKRFNAFFEELLLYHCQGICIGVHQLSLYLNKQNQISYEFNLEKNNRVFEVVSSQKSNFFEIVSWKAGFGKETKEGFNYKCDYVPYDENTFSFVNRILALESFS